MSETKTYQLAEAGHWYETIQAVDAETALAYAKSNFRPDDYRGNKTVFVTLEASGDDDNDRVKITSRSRVI